MIAFSWNQTKKNQIPNLFSWFPFILYFLFYLAIDSKSNSNEKGNISYNNLENFDKCLDYIKSGLILKGIDVKKI